VAVAWHRGGVRGGGLGVGVRGGASGGRQRPSTSVFLSSRWWWLKPAGFVCALHSSLASESSWSRCVARAKALLGGGRS
jgi:hypothetical protein